MTSVFASAGQDETALRTALDDVDIVPLALVQAQVSGHLSLLEEMASFIAGPANFQETIPGFKGPVFHTAEWRAISTLTISAR